MSSEPTANPFEQPALPLLTKPTNTETKRIFVAATRMNDGKTTTCLGLYAALQALYPRVGFIKPVGQRFVTIEGTLIDEDSYLLDVIYKVSVPIQSMSPVTIDSTLTRRYLKQPDEMLAALEDKICRAFDRVSWEKDFTLIEGTGHAGVGSVFDLSNARVAQLLNAKVILVSPGGIGRPIDEIALNKALFDKAGVEVIGAILNKVEPDKMDMIAEYAGEGLRRLGVPLLGVLPIHRMLSTPSISQIAEEIDGRWLNGHWNAPVHRAERVIVGAMTAKGIVDYLQPGVVIITPGDRDDIILAAISSAQLSGEKTISGLILSNDIMPHPKLMDLLQRTEIPVIAAHRECYDVSSRIHSMTVKTQPQDTDKFPVIKKLIMDHVDMDRLLAAF
ncbi:BioD-like phosphotransacetylase family protein [Ereboglobus sp. PH5-5]|uniref:phosphotransacetylase family protein n=1 Tax=Ereboglobus sp. PH5-5 TaxID=2940529 RepID=UPI00240522FC|nr:AAA family ATPase [Ereboglobus sp. PH5-5]MDF9832009.1 BioD-like phosphotransacetylase family protein [Ereboglobus sp. PH5-5]